MPQEEISQLEILKYRAPALEKGLDILELLAKHASGLTQAEVAKALGRSANEIYRMLTVLVHRGYISMSSEGDRYQLSMKLFTLAHRHPPMRRLVDQALPLMRKAAEMAQQSCHISIYDRREIIISSVVNSPATFGLSLRVGAIVGLYNTGSGRALAAFCSIQKRAEMIKNHQLVGGEPEMKRTKFESILDDIAKHGYVEMPSETTVGITNLAFPIFGPNEEAIAVLNCPFLKRIDKHSAPEINEVKSIFAGVAQQLSNSFGGTQMSEFDAAE